MTAAATPIQQRFAQLRSQGSCALMPFLMAGDPDLAATRAALLALQANGADLVELGIPYSDPLADGPVIQAAASRALASGTTPAKVLEMLRSLRGELTIPVVLFTYSNRPSPPPTASIWCCWWHPPPRPSAWPGSTRPAAASLIW